MLLNKVSTYLTFESTRFKIILMGSPICPPPKGHRHYLPMAPSGKLCRPMMLDWPMTGVERPAPFWCRVFCFLSHGGTMDITPVLQWSISALLVALAVFLLAKARGAWLEYRPSQQWVRNMLDQIVENVVNAAEQKFMHADSTGKDKLHYALLAAEAQCKLYGLKFDAGVIAPLIEAAVFNLAEKTKTVLDE